MERLNVETFISDAESPAAYYVDEVLDRISHNAQIEMVHSTLLTDGVLGDSVFVDFFTTVSIVNDMLKYYPRLKAIVCFGMSNHISFSYKQDDRFFEIGRIGLLSDKMSAFDIMQEVESFVENAEIVGRMRELGECLVIQTFLEFSSKHYLKMSGKYEGREFTLKYGGTEEPILSIKGYAHDGIFMVNSPEHLEKCLSSHKEEDSQKVMPLVDFNYLVVKKLEKHFAHKNLYIGRENNKFRDVRLSTNTSCEVLVDLSDEDSCSVFLVKPGTTPTMKVRVLKLTVPKEFDNVGILVFVVSKILKEEC